MPGPDYNVLEVGVEAWAAAKDFVVDASAWARSMWARVFPPEN